MRVKGGGGVVANEAWFLTVFKSTGVHPLNICVCLGEHGKRAACTHALP